MNCWLPLITSVNPLWKIAVAGLIAIFLNGCTSIQNRGSVTKTTDADAVYRLLSTRYPAGISIPDATAFMNAEGFQCSREHSSNFVEKTVNRDGSVTTTEHGPIDFILCSRKTRNGMVETVLAIALVIDNEQVTKALGNRSLTGP